MIFLQENNALIARHNGETLRIEPWGPDALRVRAFMYENSSAHDWALTEIPETTQSAITIGMEDFWGVVQCIRETGALMYLSVLSQRYLMIRITGLPQLTFFSAGTKWTTRVLAESA